MSVTEYVILAGRDVAAIDLSREIAAAPNPAACEVLHVEHCGSPIEVVYFPDYGRAGVSANHSDSDWTDADSALDALERYLEIDGKTMSP